MKILSKCLDHSWYPSNKYQACPPNITRVMPFLFLKRLSRKTSTNTTMVQAAWYTNTRIDERKQCFIADKRLFEILRCILIRLNYSVDTSGFLKTILCLRFFFVAESDISNETQKHFRIAEQTFCFAVRDPPEYPEIFCDEPNKMLNSYEWAKEERMNLSMRQILSHFLDIWYYNCNQTEEIHDLVPHLERTQAPRNVKHQKNNSIWSSAT